MGGILIVSWAGAMELDVSVDGGDWTVVTLLEEMQVNASANENENTIL